MDQFLAQLLALRADAIAFAVATCVTCWWLLRILRRHSMSRRGRRRSAIACAALIGCAVISAEFVGRQEHRRLLAAVEGIAPAYAIALEHLGYHALGPAPRDDDPLYLDLIAVQKSWLETAGAADDIYTLHRDAAGRIRVVVDAETDLDGSGHFDDGREARTPIGTRFVQPPQHEEALDLAFGGQCALGDAMTTDRWGTWVTSYAPIRAPGGAVLAVVGVDHDASSWASPILLRRLATFGVFAAVILVLGTAVVMLRMQRNLAAREALVAENRSLESANQQLERANERALQATRAKTEFLANMSHELRTPLTAILGFADLLAEGDRDGDAWREHVEVIRSSGRHLLTIITDILDLSKLESGVVDLKLAPCNPELLVWEIVALLKHRAQGKGLELRFEKAEELPARIATDEVRLRQILLNLAGNAIKFTEQGSVAIRIVHDADAGTISFLVIDSGVGIARQHLGRLFIPFSQVDSSMTRRQGGSGLGLAISQRLASMLGGSIVVASEEGRGSTFRLTLPVGDMTKDAPCDAEAAASRCRDDEPGEAPLRGRILLVEDGPDNQRLIGHVLRKQGLDVDVVDNGRLAVDALLGAADRPAQVYDLVLMDMQMPVMDGYEATRTLRAAGYCKPIVALTAHAMTRDRELCLSVGCDEFLTKPIDRAALLETIRRAVAPQGETARA